MTRERPARRAGLLLLTVVVLLAAGAVTGCHHDNGGNDNGATDPAGSGFVIAVPALPGYPGIEPTTISADGLVVAGVAIADTGRREAFRWSARDGTTALGFLPGGSNSNATAISADGAVIVGSGDGGSEGIHAIRWVAGSMAVALDPLRASTLCVAAAVSADGNVIAGTCVAPTNDGVRWTGAEAPVGLARLGTGSNATSTASAISPDGRVIGGSGHPVLAGAVIWDAVGVPTVVGGLPGDTRGYIADLSEDGTLAVGSSIDAAGHAHAFRWTPATGVVALGTRPDYVATNAVALSGGGQRTVGWATTAAGVDVAVVWDEAGRLRPVRELLSPASQADPASMFLARADGVSAGGSTITGHGTDAAGVTHGWIVFLQD